MILVLVPRGAEYRSVQRGLKKISDNSSIQILEIPAGETVREFLRDLVQDWKLVKQVFVLGLCGGLTDAVTVGQVGCYECCRLAAGRTAPQPPILGEPELIERFMSPQNIVLSGIQERGLGGFIQWKAVTTEQVIATEVEKRSLHATTGCDVVDMETFWILDFMGQRGVGVMVLRVVSDGVAGDLPDLAQVFDGAGVLQPWALVGAFVRKPVAALRLIRGSIVALQKLEDCAAMLGENFTV